MMEFLLCANLAYGRMPGLVSVVSLFLRKVASVKRVSA